MRKDSKGNPLPPRMHFKHGRYYHVRGNKWRPLSKDYYRALVQMSAIEAPTDEWGKLVAAVYSTYEQKHRAGDISKNTLAQYKNVRARIEFGFSEFTPDMVEARDVTAFLDLYEDKPNTANRMLTIIRVVFDKAVRQGICKANPAYGIKRFPEKQRDRYLTDDEYRAIWAHATPTVRLVMDMCYITAARIMDVLAIKLADITEDGIYLRQAKTGERQLHTMTDELRALVSDARRLHKVATLSPYLFHPRGKSTPYSYSAIREAFSRACTRAGVQDARIHDIRAKAGTDAEMAGIDPQALLGHTTRAMTERYIRLRKTTTVSGPSVQKLRERK